MCVFFLKELCDSVYDFWILHSPHIGGLVWLMNQVTWNLPDLRGLCSRFSLRCKQPCLRANADTESWSKTSAQRHQPSGHNRHSEISLLSNRKHIREPSRCSRGDMAALPWRDCGVWAPLVRRKEEAVGGLVSHRSLKVQMLFGASTAPIFLCFQKFAYWLF